MKLFFFLLLFSGFYPLFSQGIKISLVNKDSTEANELGFKIYDHLGIGPFKLIVDDGHIKSASDSLVCYYISYDRNSTGVLYLQNGDSVGVVKVRDGLFQYNGSKEVEHNLVSILHVNGVKGYGPTKGEIAAQSMNRFIPYIENKFSKLNEIVESYVRENPTINPEILEIIKNESKHTYLKEAVRKVTYSDYNPENFEKLSSLLEGNNLEELQKIKFRNSFITNLYQQQYLDLLYYNFYKEKILTPEENGYLEQVLKRLRFYAGFENPVRDEVRFNVLRDFFNFKTWTNVPIREYTQDYLMNTGDTEKKKFIQKLEDKALSLQNTELQAQMILSDTLMRKQVLLKPDNSEITFGQLLDSLQNKWVYVDAWATWCAPCRQEMNKLNTDIIKKSRTSTVFLSIDDDIEKWKTVLEKNYRFDGLVQHYRIDKGSLLARRLFDEEMILIPKYFLFKVSLNRFYHNVEKPTSFDLNAAVK